MAVIHPNASTLDDVRANLTGITTRLAAVEAVVPDDISIATIGGLYVGDTAPASTTGVEIWLKTGVSA